MTRCNKLDVHTGAGKTQGKAQNHTYETKSQERGNRGEPVFQILMGSSVILSCPSSPSHRHGREGV